jgi:hypothetical protein
VDSTALLATNAVTVAFWLLVWIAVVVLTIVTWVKIVTQAGYSAWWVLVPVTGVVLWISGFLLGASSLVGLERSPLGFNQAQYDAAEVLVKMAVVIYIISFVLFVIFGFSNWPALKGPRPRVRAYAGDTGTPVPPTQAPISLPPPRAQDPGWYQVGATNNDQGYWDGRTWTARRRWEGAGWTDVPVAPPVPGL